MFTGLTAEPILNHAIEHGRPSERVDAALELAWRLRIRDREGSAALQRSVQDAPAAADRLAVFALRHAPPTKPEPVLELAERLTPEPLWALRALVVGADRLLDGLAATSTAPLIRAVQAAVERAVGLVGPGDMQAVENMLGRVAMLFPERRIQAVPHYERAAKLSALAGESTAQVINLVNAASVLSTLQDPAAAMERYLQALQVLEDATEVQPRALGFVHGNIANLYFHFGSLDSARQHAQQAIEVCRRQSQAHLLLHALAIGIRIDLAEGELAAADEGLLEMARRCEAAPELEGLRVMGRTLRAAWLVLAGKPTEALEVLDQTSPALHEDGVLEQVQVRVRALFAMGQHAQVVACVQPVRQRLIEVRDPLHERALHEHVQSLRALGRHDEAIDFLTERAHFLEREPRRLARLHMGRVLGQVELRTAQVQAKDASAHAHALQSQLQRAQRMESFGQLAAGLAHDFNNALTVVTAAADHLAEGPPATEREQTLAALHRAVGQATSLTRRLLAIARQSDVELSEVDLEQHLADVLPMLRAAGGECLVQLEVASAARVHIDPALLDQALLNLVFNARDASQPRTPITIRLTGGRHRALLSVSDAGTGIAAGDLQRIFDPFFSTKGDAGTGLGLPMVWGIARQLGGDVSVHSVIGEGTTFTLALPVLATQQAC